LTSYVPAFVRYVELHQLREFLTLHIHISLAKKISGCSKSGFFLPLREPLFKGRFNLNKSMPTF
jgi:hypothetical protein